MIGYNSHITFAKIRNISIYYFYGQSTPNASLYIHNKGDGVGDSHNRFGFKFEGWGSGCNAKCGTGDGYGNEIISEADDMIKEELNFYWAIENTFA
jgi:hypothetical protein